MDIATNEKEKNELCHDTNISSVTGISSSTRKEQRTLNKIYLIQKGDK